MGSFKRLWRRLVTFFSILIGTAGLLSAIVTILAFLGLGSVAYGYIAGILPLLVVGIVVLILCVIIFIFIYTLILELRKGTSIAITAPTYPAPQMDGEVELLLKEIVYQYLPGGQSLRQRKRFKVRALRDGIGHFSDRYLWTGSGQVNLKSLTLGFNVVNQRKEEFWNYFDVSFLHPLRKSEEADFTIEWELSDPAQTAVPFLSTMIDYDTKQLSMQVIFPPELAPRGAYCYEFADYIDSLPITTQATQWNAATQSINYDVSLPKKYHKYLIRWYS